MSKLALSQKRKIAKAIIYQYLINMDTTMFDTEETSLRHIPTEELIDVEDQHEVIDIMKSYAKYFYNKYADLQGTMEIVKAAKGLK